ncbi:MAG: GAF domain-containing protein [Rufibacter sp.]
MDNKQAPIDFTLQKDYDSEFCGSIPLHLVNLIQPHGVLLTLERDSLQIVQVSENTAPLLSFEAEDILGHLLTEYVPEEQIAALRDKLHQQTSGEKIPDFLTWQGKTSPVELITLVHPKEEYLLVELEENQIPPAKASFLGLYQQIKYITTLIKHGETPQEMVQLAAAELKKFSGFDRVLGYQFDPQWNGIVIAQAKEEDMDDYMDLRFPASDVPRQSRDLYFRNPYRLIPTRSYQPARILPVINPLTQRFTDLSECNLRSVAGVHLEYMGNMNIMDSMSLPLIIENKLWGLISCHHKTAKNPSYEIRSAMELLSGILSAQLASKERETRVELKARLNSLHALLLEQLYLSQSFAEGLLNSPENLLSLLNLSGVAVLYEGSVWTKGNTPGSQELKELVYWLRRNTINTVFATDTLPIQYARAKDYSHLASGLIVLPINQEQGEYLLGFRPEVLQTISWGGNPDQAIQMEPDGKNYHPRHSFATYQETVKHTSLPWLAEELKAAEALRSAILEKILKDRY